ncbi:MAG TPA: hypothetical protein VNG69_00990 [Casimicrobiaceae bacterium]|nr:hypothetical protein [Casimicrobiaceae bacterium]
MSVVAELLIFVFVLNTLFALWVVFRNGAEWLARELADDARFQSLSPTSMRALVGGVWCLNAWALWALLDA